jgi:hypothetical protein
VQALLRDLDNQDMMGRLEERWMGALDQPGTWPEVLCHYLHSRDEETEGRLLGPPGGVSGDYFWGSM